MVIILRLPANNRSRIFVAQVFCLPAKLPTLRFPRFVCKSTDSHSRYPKHYRFFNYNVWSPSYVSKYLQGIFTVISDSIPRRSHHHWKRTWKCRWLWLLVYISRRLYSSKFIRRHHTKSSCNITHNVSLLLAVWCIIDSTPSQRQSWFAPSKQCHHWNEYLKISFNPS